MEILIVDDEVTVVSLIKKHVNWEALGISKVWTAYNAEIAKRKVQEHEIDMIVCDIEMPQENGLVFLQWVRAYNPEIRTIILTAYPEFQYAQTAIKLGVKQYLLKPISFAELSENLMEMGKEIREQRNHIKIPEVPPLAENGSLEQAETERSAREEWKKPENSEWMVQEVMDYIARHYMEPIGRQEIENAMHLNGDYLNRIFKAATGYSLIQYIQYYRVLVAKQLMREKHTAIADIGSKVGLDTPSYFGRIFKKWTGQTPYEYYIQVQDRKEV